MGGQPLRAPASERRRRGRGRLLPPSRPLVGRPRAEEGLAGAVVQLVDRRPAGADAGDHLVEILVPLDQALELRVVDDEAGAGPNGLDDALEPAPQNIAIERVPVRDADRYRALRDEQLELG